MIITKYIYTKVELYCGEGATTEIRTNETCCAAQTMVSTAAPSADKGIF